MRTSYRRGPSRSRPLVRLHHRPLPYHTMPVHVHEMKGRKQVLAHPETKTKPLVLPETKTKSPIPQKPKPKKPASYPSNSLDATAVTKTMLCLRHRARKPLSQRAPVRSTLVCNYNVSLSTLTLPEREGALDPAHIGSKDHRLAGNKKLGLDVLPVGSFGWHS